MPGACRSAQAFDTITLKLFEKHGIKQAGFWTTEVGESNHNLIYLVAYDSMADREKKVGGIFNRPGMDRAARETEKNGPW